MPAIQKFYRQGQIIFREGEPSKSLYIIRKGCISIRKMKGNAFVEIARLYPNEIVGEMSFFDHLPRSATAVAANEVEALEIPFDGMDKIYNAIPPYMRTIMAAMADRLRKANDVVRRLQKVMAPDGSSSGGSSSSGPSARDAMKAASGVGNGGSGGVASPLATPAASSKASSDDPFADIGGEEPAADPGPGSDDTGDMPPAA